MFEAERIVFTALLDEQTSRTYVWQNKLGKREISVLPFPSILRLRILGPDVLQRVQHHRKQRREMPSTVQACGTAVLKQLK